MAGIVKRKYQSETQKFKKEFTRPLSLMVPALPCIYDKHVILALYKELYPLGWEKLTQRYKLYRSKDQYLQEMGKKIRYKHDEPETFFFNLAKVKHLLSKGQRDKHKVQYHSQQCEQAYEELRQKRDLKVKNKIKKDEAAKELMQRIEPVYIDVFIAAYHKKGVTTHDKLEIFNELKRYECKKTTTFFHKLNDSERNNQIRRMAFEHLQNIGAFVKLRKNFKGKSKTYMTEQDLFDVTPKDLVERIESESVQNKKTYDVFISHSYLDYFLLIGIKDELNSKNVSVYCDWIGDNDFLKRSLTSEYTEIVLKKRIEQSRNVLFVQTNNSMDEHGKIASKWVQMELEYANEKSKPLYCLNLNDSGTKFKSIEFDFTDNKFSIPTKVAERFRT